MHFHRYCCTTYFKNKFDSNPRQIIPLIAVIEIVLFISKINCCTTYKNKFGSNPRQIIPLIAIIEIVVLLISKINSVLIAIIEIVVLLSQK